MNTIQKEKIKILFKQLKDNFKQSNIIKLYKYCIEEFEKDYMFKIKSHNSLCKKNIIPINLIPTDINKTEILYFYGNTTIKEIYGYLIEKYNSEKYTFDINLKIEKEKEIENKILDKSYYNKTLNELITKKTELIINIKEVIQDKLITNENEEKKLTKTFENILKKWFRSFSNGRNKMNKKRFADLVNKITNKKDDFFKEDNIKILGFFKKYSYNSEYIKEEQFINFYKTICLQNDKTKMDLIRNNIKNMNLRPDLTKLPEEINIDFSPRFYLSNEIKGDKNLYIMDIFDENYKNEIDEELYDFKSFLSTNEKLYNNILENFNSNENMKLSNSFDKYMNNLYILIIIESIIEDAAIQNNKNIEKNKVIDVYKYFKGEEDKKLKFFIKFFDYNYEDIISYASKILEKLNGENDYNAQKHNLCIRCCSKCLDIINNIYISYHNLKYDNPNIEKLGLESLKEKIKENVLDKKIEFKNLVIQILSFIKKYYNQYDNVEEYEFKEKLPNLIKNCYFILFSLLYKNNEIFNYIENSKSKELFHSVISNIFDLSKNPKNIVYMKLLLINISEQIEIELNHEFLSYLIQILYKKLKDILSKKDFDVEIHSLYLIHLIKYSEDRDQLKKNLKPILIEIMKLFYNHYKSKDERTNEKALFSLTNKILEYKRINKYEIFDNDAFNYFKDFLNELESTEETKMNEKDKKFKGIVENLESNKDKKFIFKIDLNELISTKKQNNKENADKFLEIINKYCIKYLETKNEINKDILILLVSKINDLKKEENKLGEEKDSNKSDKNLSNQKKDKLKKKIKKNSEYVGLRNLDKMQYLNCVIQ